MRRLNWWKCGNTYSYSESRMHICMKDSGIETHFNQNQKDSFNVPHSFSGDKFCFSDSSEEEVQINCPEIDEDMKGTEPELTDFPLSPDLRKRLKDRLRKQFNEDLSYFEDDDTDSGNDGDSADVDEDWAGYLETHDADKDFKHEKLRETSKDESVSISDKWDTLVFWLTFFLVSWQSAFSITDSAMEMLLKFLSRFLCLLGTFDENSVIARLAKCLPNTLYKLRKGLGLLGNDEFIKYVVCPKCKTLYDYKDYS